jgi:hypothetical protein
MQPRHGVVTRFFHASLLAGGVGLTGCAAGPAPMPHALHPIPETRARDLIAHTFITAGVGPQVDRTVVVKERRVQLEVAAAGRRFGVAYLTAQDWAKAGDALPPRPSDGALVVAVGDGGMRILCLFADDYTEDDDTNAEHRATTIAADRKLDRDVRDFLHRAEAQRWP